ncbi:MAG: hypothetical protein H0X51_01760 [Parachlamydiaceae bacterium]|nr:hypothetical protein [Parachlamydiaceae bacterium]
MQPTNRNFERQGFDIRLFEYSAITAPRRGKGPIDITPSASPETDLHNGVIRISESVYSLYQKTVKDPKTMLNFLKVATLQGRGDILDEFEAQMEPRFQFLVASRKLDTALAQLRSLPQSPEISQLKNVIKAQAITEMKLKLNAFCYAKLMVTIRDRNTQNQPDPEATPAPAARSEPPVPPSRSVPTASSTPSTPATPAAPTAPPAPATPKLNQKPSGAHRKVSCCKLVGLIVANLIVTIIDVVCRIFSCGGFRLIQGESALRKDLNSAFKEFFPKSVPQKTS